MTKAIYKGKHLIGLTFSVGNVHDDGANAWWKKKTAESSHLGP